MQPKRIREPGIRCDKVQLHALAATTSTGRTVAIKVSRDLIDLCEIAIERPKVLYATNIATSYTCFRNVMSTLADPFSDACNTNVNRIDEDKDNRDLVSIVSCFEHAISKRSSGQAFTMHERLFAIASSTDRINCLAASTRAEGGSSGAISAAIVSAPMYAITAARSYPWVDQSTARRKPIRRLRWGYFRRFGAGVSTLL